MRNQKAVRKVTGWAVDHPWIVIGISVVLTLGFVALIPRVGTEQDFRDFLPKGDSAVQALEEAEDRFGAQMFSLIAIEVDDTIFNVSTLTKIREMEERISELPGVDEVQSPLSAQIITGTEAAIVVGPAAPEEQVPATPEEMDAFRERVMNSRMLRGRIVSENGRAAAIMIRMDPGSAADKELANRIRVITSEYETPEKIYLAGGAFEALETEELMVRDLSILIPLVIAVIIAVLYFSFRSVRGVFIPMLVVGLSVIWAVGLMGLLGVAFSPMSVIMPIILLAIGSADGIHIVNRYYEEAAKGSTSKKEIIVETMVDMFGPVVMTSLTTAAGFLALMSSFLTLQQEFGVITCLGILVAMVLSLLLIPAVFGVLPLPGGERARKKEWQLEHNWLSRGLACLGGGVYRHRVWVITFALVLLAVSLVLVPRLRIETEISEFVGENSSMGRTMAVMKEHFGGALQLAIEIDTGRRDGLKDPAILNEIVALQEYLESREDISRTDSVANFVREMNQKFHGDDPAYYVVPDNQALVAQLMLLFTMQGGGLGSSALGDFSAGEVFARIKDFDSTAQLEELVIDVQGFLDERFEPIGVDARMVGIAQVSISLFNRLITSQATSLLTSLAAVWLIVSLLMGSLIAGLISLAPLLLTVAINFGFMAATGRPLDIATMMIGSIVIGIGIDYAIHFQSRYRIEFARSGNPDEAIRQTMRTTGRGIVYNAVTVGLGFAVLIFSAMAGLSIFGSLVATSMAISAFSAITIIPALLAILKPRFLQRKTEDKNIVKGVTE